MTLMWTMAGHLCGQWHDTYVDNGMTLMWTLAFAWYPFHPRVTAVTRKDTGHSAKSAGGRLQLNTHIPYVCGFA